MVNILNETTVTLTEAAKRLPHRPHASTLWRWYKTGVRGRRLETAVVGGRRVTSLEALARFSEALTAERDGAAIPKRPIKRDRAASIARAKKVLERAGV